jgi:hypothetical protein
MNGSQLQKEPVETIRSTAAGMFDAIDAHPWAGAQLAREPWQPAVIRLFETTGSSSGNSGWPHRRSSRQCRPS